MALIALIMIFGTSAALACAPTAAPVDAAIAALTTMTGDRCTIAVDRGLDDGLTITIRGRSFDGRHLLKAIASGPDQQTGPVLGASWDIKVDRFEGFNDEVLRNVFFRLERRHGDIAELSLVAGLGGGGLTGHVEAQDDGRQRIVITTENAGAFFSLFGVYPHLRGGTMSLVLESSSDGLRGTLKIEKSALAQEPMLRSLGILLPPYRGHHRNNRLQISRLRLDFILSSRPTGLTVANGILVGPEIGATIDGTFDVSRGLNLAGTIVPVAINNNAPGILPQLTKDEGLICVTYRITGPASAPKLQINPFGIATQGLLRRLLTLEP